jgi:hypothetical protein
LIWLPQDGARGKDALLAWKLALGDQAIVAVVDAPIPERLPDGRLASRWAYDARFAKDAGPAGLGLHRMVEYLSRRLPVDPDRVVLAGEGGGGATLLWAGLYDDDSKVTRIAVRPTLPHDLQAAAIPDGKPAGTTLILDAEPDRPAMAKTLEGFAKAGTPATTRRLSPETPDEGVKAVADALGVTPAPAGGGEAVTFALPVATPLAKQWAQLWVRVQAKAGVAVTVAEGKPGKGASAFDEAWLRAQIGAEGAAIPRPPAAFGGATILVLPQRAPKAMREAWTPIVEAAAKRRGGFSPLAMVTDKELAEKVAELAKGTSNLLIVPVEFAADDARMAALQALVTDVPEGKTVWWLPGLGGAAVHAAAKP